MTEVVLRSNLVLDNEREGVSACMPALMRVSNRTPQLQEADDRYSW